MSGRPVPVPDELSQPYWDNCARHVLTLPRCSHCSEYTFPPDVSCRHCHSLDPRFVFEPISGTGRIRTWTVIRQSFLEGFDVPFVLVDVELDGQTDIRMIGRLADGADVPLKIGMAVKVAFEDIAPDVSVPGFKLVAN